MNQFQAVEQRGGDGERGALLERPAGADPFAERLSGNEFHHHVSGPVRFEKTQDPDDIRMAERGERARFVEKPGKAPLERLRAGLGLRLDQSVQPKSESSSESFKWGLSRFLDESRTLASFRHPNIVRVLRFFEANRTAYMVMEFVAGQPLGEWIRTRRALEQSAVLAIATPLLDGLELFIAPATCTAI